MQVVKVYKKNLTPPHIDLTSQVAQGLVLKENLDRTLNHATILLRNEGKNYFKILDVIRIEVGLNDSWEFLIADIQSDAKRSLITPLYSHTLTLIEPTKYLEKIILQSMSFTNRSDTLLNQIDKLLVNAEVLEYDISLTPRFSLSTNARNLLTGIKGEDFFFNKSTLKEALDEMVGVGRFRTIIKEIPVDYNDIEIDLIDLAEEKEEIDLSSYDLLKEFYNQNIEYYAREIEAYGDNSFSGNRKTIFFPGPRGWAVPKTKEATLTTENAMFEVSFPIEEIKSFIVNIKWHATGSPGATTPIISQELDIASNVVDDETYLILENNPSGELINTEDFYKENTLPYQKQQAELAIGTTYRSGAFGMFSAKYIETAIKNTLWKDPFFRSKVAEYGIASLVGISIFLDDFDIRELQTRIEYQPYIDAHIKITKQNEENNLISTTMISQQSEKIIDLKRYGETLENQINSLGNRKLIIERKIYLSDMSTLWEVQQRTTDNFYITERELSFMEDFVKTRFTFTENYIDLSTKIGIDRRNRIYNIPLENFVRDILIKHYLILDLTPHVEDSWLVQDIMPTFDTAIGGVPARPITNALVKMDYEVGVSSLLEMSVASYSMANSMLFKFKFADNYSAGMSQEGRVLGGIKQVANPYVDENGEYKVIEIKLFNDYQKEIPSDKIKDLPSTKVSYYNNVDMDFDSKFYILKDAYEQHQFTIQIEMLSADKGLLIGSKLAENCSLINFDRNELYLYMSDNETYSGLNDKVAKGVSKKVGIDATITTHLNYIEVGGTYFDENINNWKSWAIADQEGNILIAVNKTWYVIENRIYFEYKRSLV